MKTTKKEWELDSAGCLGKGFHMHCRISWI